MTSKPAFLFGRFFLSKEVVSSPRAGLKAILHPYLAQHPAFARMGVRWTARWVRGQVALARDCFQEGKIYVDSPEVLRCKLAGVWYCARFECVLDAIERDGYRLRLAYPEGHPLGAWLDMIRLGVLTVWNHYARPMVSLFSRLGRHPEFHPQLDIAS